MDPLKTKKIEEMIAWHQAALADDLECLGLYEGLVYYEETLENIEYHKQMIDDLKNMLARS